MRKRKINDVQEPSTQNAIQFSNFEFIQARDDDTNYLLTIEVKANAKSNTIRIDGDFLVVEITAAPTKGKANKAIHAFLAKKLGIPKSNVDLIRGQTSHSKIFSVHASKEILIAFLMKISKETK